MTPSDPGKPLSETELKPCLFCGGLLALSHTVGYKQFPLYRCGTDDCVGAYMALEERQWNNAHCWKTITQQAEIIRAYGKALERISEEHCMYEHGGDQYGIGVTDGHRCAAGVAKEVLKQSPLSAESGRGER